MKKVAIIGAGELGRQFLFYIREQGQMEIVGFIDDFVEKNTIIDNVPVIGKVDDILMLYQKGEIESLLIGIGYLHFDLREEIFNKFKGIVPFATFVHKTCYVASTAMIEEGCFLYPMCVVDKDAHICADVVLNLGCIISHNSIVGAHCFCGPRSTVAGFSQIGEKSMLGIGSVVIDNVTVNQGVKLGGGSVTVCNLESCGTYIGVPAKQLIKNIK